MDEAEKAVLKTIVYYDCLDYPLTLEELNTFLFSGVNLDITFGLGALKDKDLIEEVDGFYFLKGREALFKVREERNRLAKGKWKKTFKAVRRLRIIPYLRLIFASGSLAMSNTSLKSDLDVLIVVKHGRIWLARILIILLLSLLGVRRTRYQKIAPDKICLNHFITDESLYIPRKSIYTAQIYARLVPIFADNEGLIDEFTEVNSWVGEWVRGWPECLKNQKSKIKMQNDKSKIKNFLEKILNTKLGNWLENILRKYQLRRINNFHLTYKPGGRVKADDESLEFHPDSPELRIIKRYNRKMDELGFPELGKELDSGLISQILTESVDLL